MMVPESGNRPDFEPVITALLDPIVQMCEQAAEAHKSKGALSRRRTSSDIGSNRRDSLSVDAILARNNSLDCQIAETSSKIYLINCLSAIQQPLLGHEVAAKYVNSLPSVIEKHINVLVEKEVDAILARCGLSSKISYIQNLNNEDQDDKHEPLAEVADMSPQVLSESLRTFFGIVTGNEGSLPEFGQLQVPKLRSDTSSRVARALSEAYEFLYGVITDPRNHYADPKSLVRHSPDQIRTILEI